MKLTDVIAKVHNTAGEQETMPLTTFMSSLRHNGSYWELSRKRVEPAAMEQLVKDRLDGIPALLKDESLSTGFLMDYLHLKADALPQHNITVRYGETVKGVIPESQAEYTNINLVNTIGNMWQDGSIPENVSVHRFHINPEGTDMFLRLTAPQWNLGDFFGGLAVSNEELKSEMKVRPGVAKVSCFNWVLRENIFRPEDRSAIQPTLEAGLNMIGSFASEGMVKMAQMGQVKVEHIDVLFELIAQELKLPENVKGEMYKYWANGGSGRTVDDALQAVTWGVQALTDNTGKRQPKWSTRENLEERIWAWTGELHNLHTQGVDLDENLLNRELIKKSKVLEALARLEDPTSYVRALPADGFAK